MRAEQLLTDLVEDRSTHACTKCPAGTSFRRRKWFVTVALNACAGGLLVLALAGCATRYDILLNNGATIAAYSKPVRDGHGRLIFKNEVGEKVSVNEVRVIEIKAK